MKKGFTLIEMSVVLLIIGILAGIVLRNIGGQSIQARDIRRVSDLRILTNYLAQYLSKKGEFPNTPDTSNNDWAELNNAFSSVGIFVNLPKPPAGSPYVYYPCSDATGVTNHFILRAQLEQPQSQAPAVYEGSYNSSTAPSGWDCDAPSGTGYDFNCSWESRYYCITQ